MLKREIVDPKGFNGGADLPFELRLKDFEIAMQLDFGQFWGSSEEWNMKPENSSRKPLLGIKKAPLRSATPTPPWVANMASSDFLHVSVRPRPR